MNQTGTEGSKSISKLLNRKVAKSKSFNEVGPITNMVLNLIFISYSILCLFPLLLVIAVSFSSEKDIAVNGYKLWPEHFSLASYQYLAHDMDKILNGYGVSILVTVIGTVLGLAITALFAYPLSRRDFHFRNFFSFFIFFTMIFGGGLVPWYLVYTNLFPIQDTLLALIVPGLLLNAFYVIMMRTFFQITIHPSIIESATMDGAGELRVFFQIVLPLSTPVLATVGLFYTLQYWNNWFNSLVFINNNENMVNLQYLMYKTMANIQYLTQNAQASGGVSSDLLAKYPNETVRMAMALIGMGPIVLAYPFFQKYFVKGLTIGAVKG
jgi:putative aldouronate transport system permease protein